jgi:outer membrane protein assembly factor BamB
VILGRTAMALGDEAVYGIDLETGDVVWDVPRSGGPLSVPAVAPGVDGSPDLLLYLDGPASGAGAAEGEGTDVVAIDLADRSERWRTSLDEQARTGVTVDGDVAYVGDQAGTLYAVGVDDGAVGWTVELDEAEDGCAAFPGMRIDAPIAVADGAVVAVGSGSDDRTSVVSAHDAATGECRWRQAPQIGSSIASPPTAGDGRVLVAYVDRLVRSFDARDGTERWSALALSFFLQLSPPSTAGGAVYVADVEGGLYRLDAEDGARAWSHQLNERVIRSAPVVAGEAVLLGLNDGRLVAVDATSGHLVWQSEAMPGLVGAIAVTPDVLVAVKGGRDAGLVAFEHDPAGALVDVAPPTDLEPGTTLARAGLAVAIVLAVVLVPGVLARRRFGDAFSEEERDGGGGDDEEEP